MVNSSGCISTRNFVTTPAENFQVRDFKARVVERLIGWQIALGTDGVRIG